MQNLIENALLKYFSVHLILLYTVLPEIWLRWNITVTNGKELNLTKSCAEYFDY
jgi:hypothetical protein